MGFIDRVKSVLPGGKPQPQEIKNNIPNEKAQMRQTFGVYCNKNHGTNGEKLCAKCTALLSVVMLKMNRCPYGITKPVCDKCEIMCFGPEKNKEFLTVMSSATSSSMLMKHPMTALKHKLAKVSVDIGKQRAEEEKRKAEKAKAKTAEEKAKAKEEAAKNGTETKAAAPAPKKKGKNKKKK